MIILFSEQQSEQLRVSHQEHASYPEEWLNPITKSLDIMRWLKAHAGIRSSLCEEFDFSSAEVNVMNFLTPARIIYHHCRSTWSLWFPRDLHRKHPVKK